MYTANVMVDAMFYLASMFELAVSIINGLDCSGLDRWTGL